MILSRIIDSQSQTRHRIPVMSSDLGALGIRLNTIRFEDYRATFSKPRDCLPGCCKPRTSILQVLNQVTITCVPQSLWSETTIMPVDRYAAPKMHHIVRQACKDLRRLSLG